MPSFTLAQLEARVWDGLDANTGFYTEPQVRSVLNEGLRRLNLLTGFNQATVAIPTNTVAGLLNYSTPAGILIPQTVYIERRELDPTSLTIISQRYRSWVTDTTATKGPTARWAPIGISQFVIHPIDAVGGRLIEVTGVAPTTPLVGQNDVVNLEDTWVDILIDYGRSRVMLKEGGKPFADASQAYQDMIRKLKNMIVWQGFKFPVYWVAKQQEPSQGRGT